METFEESGIVENKTEMIEEFGNDFCRNLVSTIITTFSMKLYCSTK